MLLFGAGTSESRAEPAAISLQELIDTAHPGDELRLKSGQSYEGPAVIDRPVTIVGYGDVTIRNRSDQPALTLQANGITLRGFRIADDQINPKSSVVLIRSHHNRITDVEIVSQAGGIYLREANDNVIENSRIIGANAEDKTEPYSRRGNGIDLHASADNLIQGNELIHVHDGVYVESSSNTRVIGNTAVDSRYGYHFMFSDMPEMIGNIGSNNVTGGMVMGVEGAIVRDNRFEKQTESVNSQGILLYDVHRSVIENNHVEGNRVGLYIENSSNNDFVGNDAINNFIGMQMIGSEGNSFKAGVFVANVVQAQATESSNNVLSGNYWDDFRGLDTDGDGTSDLPYEIDPLFLKITEQAEAYQLFFQSPGLPFLTQLFRENTDSWLKDTRPLIDQPTSTGGPSSEGSTSAPYALFLLLVSVTIIYQWGYKRK